MPIEVIGLADCSVSTRLVDPFVQFQRTRHTLHFFNGLQLIDRFVAEKPEPFLREAFQLSSQATQLMAKWRNLHPAGGRTYANGIVASVANCYQFQEMTLSTLGETALRSARFEPIISVFAELPRATHLAEGICLTTQVQNACLSGVQLTLAESGLSQSEIVALGEAESVLVSIRTFCVSRLAISLLAVSVIITGGGLLYRYGISSRPTPTQLS